MLVRRDDLELQERFYLPQLKESIFIHPTDTHYAIGCDATNSRLCLKLRLIKRWHTQPLPIIAPSKDWIRENVDLPEQALRQLPGPVTIMARLKNPDCICPDVHLGKNTIAIRMPKHWIGEIVAKLGIPVISTCANKHSQELMTSLDNADPQLVEAAGLVLHEGPKQGKPMVFIDYTELQIIEP